MNFLWDELSGRAGVKLDSSQHQRLYQFLDLVVEANRRMNLTAVKDRPAAELLHVADTLTLLPYLPAGTQRLADVGSGGGVPGVVLAIVRPDVQVTLIEATKKKADFLRSAALELGLENVTVQAIRAEDAGRRAERESFDVVAARAVATMDWLAEWLLPLAKVGGIVLAMKGPKVAQELPDALKAIKLLGGGQPEVLPALSPAGEGRVIVTIAKIGPTPKQYPRPATSAKGQRL
jgi:16S rRNA (guanine527-N7)-methyltransferase